MSDNPYWIDTRDLYWIPRSAEIARSIRAGMPEPAAFEQTSMRWVEDVTPTTWLETEGTDHDLTVSGTSTYIVRLRMLVRQTNTAYNEGPQTFYPVLYASKNGGAYLTLDGLRLDGVSTGVSTNITDGNDVTGALTGGTGTEITDNNGYVTDVVCQINDSGGFDRHYK